MDELMAVKRRAPPRLFRNRKGFAHQQDDRVHQVQGSPWNRHHPYGDTAFLPVLNFDRSNRRPDRCRELPVRVICQAYGDSDWVSVQHKPLERRHANTSRDGSSGHVLENSTSNALVHGTEICQGLRSPNSPSGRNSHVPNPQQIIQAMAQSRIATHSTPTTPRMSPWKHSSWNAEERAVASRQVERRTATQVQSGIKANFSFPAFRTAQSKAEIRPSACDTTSGSHELDITHSQDPHYVIEPDMGMLRPLNVPLYGDKPLPSPTHWSEQGEFACISSFGCNSHENNYTSELLATFIPSCLPYVVSVPPAGSNYAAFVEKQSPLTTKDIIGSFGGEGLQSSYLGATHEIC